ncbi:MAG TPA: protein phosphatase 2C domain-containing protein, partial [Ramlibacter sp.]
MKFSVFQISRKGGREKNEDRMGYCYTRESGLFVLADGMGGHPEGEVAAQLALQTVSALFQKEARPVVQDIAQFLSTAVMAAHHQIIRYASEKGMLDTPRTTLVACIVQGSSATWVHCGDSRLYVVRSGELLTRTRDHSYLEQQAGAAAAGNSVVQRLERINRNILFTCLGSPTKPVFDVTGPVTLQQ